MDSAEVMVIDDDDDIREMISLVLELHGYRATLAADGKQAMAQLGDGRPLPSVILLDLMMPLMSGTELLDKIRSDARLADIPVVVISGAGNAWEVASKGGAATCLTKPVEMDDLLAVVRHYAPAPAS